MHNHLHNIVDTLNRLYKLNYYAARFCKPYRASKIRNCYECARLQVDIQALHSGNYREIFSPDFILEKATEMKLNAVRKNNYEEASQYRDLENARLKELLLENQIGISDKFFVKNGLLYEVSAEENRQETQN